MTDREETPSRPPTAEGYDKLAALADENLDERGSPWGDSHFQRHYSWPATRELLPDVDGERVLLAGCGRGDHVEWFLDGGATVVGVDASERALATARERFGDRNAVEFRRGDLTDPLEFESGSFDLVCSHLVLGHLEAWTPVFAEFRRVLADRGTLAFAAIHPQYLRRKEAVTNHYETQKIVVQWPGAEIPTYYRPTSEMVGPLVDTDFELERFEAPKPQASFEAWSPERYAAAMRSPQVLCVRARAASDEQ